MAHPVIILGITPRRTTSPNAVLPSIDPARPTWRDQARCRQMVVTGLYTQREIFDLFFPTRYSPPAWIAEAKKICAGCPVRKECLQEAIDLKQTQWGIQGGLTAEDRRRVVSAARRSYRG